MKAPASTVDVVVQYCMAEGDAVWPLGAAPQSAVLPDGSGPQPPPCIACGKLETVEEAGEEEEGKDGGQGGRARPPTPITGRWVIWYDG